MPKFHTLCSVVNRHFSTINSSIGKAVSWLIVLMAFVTTLIVFSRSVFNVGSVGTQESLTYMHALVIMLASAYTFKLDGHVRVDIFYRKFNHTQKAWVDTLGCTLLLLPLSFFTIFVSWEYVANSWQVMETSADAGGIPAVFVLKSLLLAFGVLLTLQAFAEITRNLIPLTYLDAPESGDNTND